MSTVTPRKPATPAPPDSTWVLGLVGVAASALTVEGQFTLIDSLIGVLLLLVVLSVPDINRQSTAFRRAYSAIFAICCVFIAGSTINATMVYFGIAETKILDLWHPGEEHYAVWLVDCVIVFLWAVIFTMKYLSLRDSRTA